MRWNAIQTIQKQSAHETQNICALLLQCTYRTTADVSRKAESMSFFKEDTRLIISSCTLQSLLKFPNLSTTFSIHSDSVPWRGMYWHPLYEPSFCVKLISSFQFGSHSRRCGLPTMISNERALVTATLNLCKESKLHCRSEAMGRP